MNNPSNAALAELQEQLAEVARDTARLLVQPQYDSADVEALDVRAADLRARIDAAQADPRKAEPVELRRGYGGAWVSGG
jgi:hypothetical protein